MAFTENEEINKTQGDELNLDCVNCAGKISHKVVVSIDTTAVYDEIYHYQLRNVMDVRRILSLGNV